MTAAELLPATRAAVELLLLAMADDELVIGWSDSEWTGIAPLLEEDVAMSSLAQDELGHARALYELLAGLVDDDRDADAIAYDRPPEGHFHARLLDHPTGDWAATIARRYLYETADAVRLEALARSAWRPLAELVAKIRREERYHLLHVSTWLQRLASAEGEPRRRLLAALEDLGPDAASVLAPLPNELALEMAGVVDAPSATLDGRWRAAIGPTLERLRLPMPGPLVEALSARSDHSDAFRSLWSEVTSVRSSDPAATW
ncbi:MAG TPA: 1,2-phenylacetyl-CoA epoxidase subunit PaaC [Candidatus Limnocylindrales bacterium]|nr:1,2-phenylacetyl-CoA epoxidase subunit PaaC [Candidatus Limnocylindrales bacterium]